ncbi:MAG: type II secretion system protein GspJ [Sphingomonadaceae bacterium]
MAARGARAPRAAGFTLVEMLVAVLLFGIVASIAAALTGSAARSFATSDTALARVSDLESARALLAADLGQAAPRPSLAADGRILPAFTLLPEGFVLVRRRPEGAVPAIEKVAWGLVDGRLVRQPFPAIDGAEPAGAIEIVPGVEAIRLRVAGPEGWTDHWAPARPEALPRALELELVRADGLSVTMKFLVAA